MPGLDLATTSPASSSNLDRPLFRSHKSLPRKTHVIPDVQVTHAAPADHNGESVHGAALATAPSHPLTPPGVVAPEVASPNNDFSMQKAASSQSMIGVVTPSKPSHPPTPETTPPRLTPTAHRPGFSQFGRASCSSREDSFQTAHEMISDSETETPGRSPQSLLQKALQGTKGVDTTASSTTPTDSWHDTTPRSQASGRKTKRGDVEESTPTRPQTLDNPNDYSSPNGAANVSPQSRNRNVAQADDLEVPRTRQKYLKGRINSTQEPTSKTSIERFRETIGWPAEDSADAAGPEESRRFSGVSASSTVEAMIIESSRPAKRVLRHTGKNSSLRSASSPITKSEKTLVASNTDSRHRLIHKAARISETDRKSIASEISVSGSSTLGAPPQNTEVVPVVVIPERRSSLRSSASASRNPSRAGSLRSSRRPHTAGSGSRSLDVPRQKKRTFSESSAPTILTTRNRKMEEPIIPPRESSLSAPTSQNNSRSTSLTSESLRSHTRAMEHQAQKEPTKPQPLEKKRNTHDSQPTDSSRVHSILIGVEDMAHLRPPSGPFTQLSLPSSSPGPIEINEARTVAFFPHTNESLLLVSQQGQPKPRGQIPRINYQIPNNIPRTPEVPVQYDVDSPLRNPRQPPKPPVRLTVQPPQESQVKPQSGMNGSSGIQERPLRRFGSARRSWRVRPRSETFNSFTRSLSLRSAKNRKAGQDIDDRLQPFWRPRRFWPESSEAEEESPQETSSGSEDPKSDQIISNSLGMPQQRVVFEGPPLVHRSADTRHYTGKASRYPANRKSFMGGELFRPDALYSQTSLHRGRSRWWRLRLRFSNMYNIRKRLRGSLQQRAEERHEARREKLKQSIGEARLIGSSTQTKSIAL